MGALGQSSDRATGMSRIAASCAGAGTRSAWDRALGVRGTSIALVLALVPVTLSGCLIPQPVHFDEPPNSPPAISDVESPDHPIHEIIQLYDPMPPMPVDGGATPPAPPLTLRVSVYDADVSQTLSWLYQVDGVTLDTDDL